MSAIRPGLVRSRRYVGRSSQDLKGTPLFPRGGIVVVLTAGGAAGSCTGLSSTVIGALTSGTVFCASAAKSTQ
jgi:hypothetical protein